MSFFIGVLFFCVQDSCYFIKLHDNFEKREQCEQAVKQMYDYTKQQGIGPSMTCLKVEIKPNV